MTSVRRALTDPDSAGDLLPMRRGIHWLATAVACCFALRSVAAQTKPDTRVTVVVRDTGSTGVPGAEVSIVTGLNEGRASGTTDEHGRTTLAFPRTAAVSDYQLVVRKIGYERADRFFRVTKDSLSFDVVMRQVVQLGPVIVTADEDIKRKSYHIDADAIASSDALLLDATDILAKLRPYMICGRECSPLENIAATTRAPVRKCPTFAFQPRRTCPPSNAPPSIETNVWVNGRRIRLAIPNEMAVARQHGVLAGLSPASMTVLSEIKPEHIAEMTYVDQWDTSIDKAGAQGGLFVVLKPGVEYEPGRPSYVAAVETPSAAPPPPSTALPGYRGRLLGVFDRDTGEPIEGAFVIDMTTGTRARTTSTGTVSLVFLPEGGTPVRIVKEGYDDLNIAVEISPNDINPVTLVMAKHAKPPAQ